MQMISVTVIYVLIAKREWFLFLRVEVSFFHQLLSFFHAFPTKSIPLAIVDRVEYFVTHSLYCDKVCTSWLSLTDDM